MADKELKPVSPAMRAALALLGETPAEHQAEVQSRPRGNGKGKSHKLPPEPKLTPAEEIAKRWESPSWRPIARVLFIRETTCTHCGEVSLCSHWPETFIKERLIRDGVSFRYLPARTHEAAGLQLPHQREVVKLTTHACHLCPDWQESQPPKVSTQCLEEMLRSAAADIGLSPSTAQTSTTSSESESGSPPTRPFEPSSAPEDLAWSQDLWPDSEAPTTSPGPLNSAAHGLSSANFVFAPSAPAKHTSSPIMLAGESALVTNITSSNPLEEA